MDEEAFIKMLTDKAVSDRIVFKALLRYLRTAEATNPEKEENFSTLVAEQRPEVWKKFAEYVTAGHKYCCGPNAIRDDDNCAIKAYKTVLMYCHRIKFYIKFGE